MNRSILYLAIPNILSNLTIPLLGIVDVMLMGHLEGVFYLGAIAIGSMIFDSIYWIFGFLRMGTTGMTAQAYGAQNHDGVLLLLQRSLVMALGIAAGLLILQYPISKTAFYLIDGSAEVETFAQTYFNIRIWSAPATLSLYAIQGWFLGIQNVRIPLLLVMLVNSTNILLSWGLVSLLDLGVEGAALGTLGAQYLGLCAAFYFIRKTFLNTQGKPSPLQVILCWSALRSFLNVNFDIFIRTLCLVGVFSFFTAKSATYGDTALAANTILLKLWAISSFGIDGFAHAAESLVGKYLGQRHKENLYHCIRLLIFWILGLGGTLSLTFYLAMKPLLAAFTDQATIIDTALDYQWWTIVTPLVSGICYIWDGIFLGATATKSLRNSMLFCTFIIFLPLFYSLEAQLGLQSLWLALISFMLARGISLSFYAYRQIPQWLQNTNPHSLNEETFSKP